MGEVTVDKRGNVWRYRFDGSKIGGKRIQIAKSGFKTKRDAMAAGMKAYAEYKGGAVEYKHKEMSYSDFLDYWMEHYCKSQLKGETISNYEKKIRVHIKPALGKYSLASINPGVLQKLINDMFNRGYSRNTLSVVKGVLTGSLRYAVEPLHYLVHSPAVYIKLPSYRAESEVPTRTEPHVYINRNQWDEIIKRFPEGTSTHVPLMIGYRCGMRIGEVFGLAWDDIDWDKSTISIKRQIQCDERRNTWCTSDPKYDSFRTIEVDSGLLDLLRRTKDHQDRARVFYGEKFMEVYESDRRELNYDGIGHQLNLVNIRDNGKIITPRVMQHTSAVIHQQLHFKEFDFHSFRHTHATMLAEAGAPPKYVQKRLGHKNIAVTMKIYQLLTDEISRQGTVKLDGLYE